MQLQIAERLLHGLVQQHRGSTRVCMEKFSIFFAGLPRQQVYNFLLKSLSPKPTRSYYLNVDNVDNITKNKYNPKLLLATCV